MKVTDGVIVYEPRQSGVNLPQGSEDSIRNMIITRDDKNVYTCMINGFLRDLNLHVPMDIFGIILHFYGERHWIHVMYFNHNEDMNCKDIFGYKVKKRMNIHYVIPLEKVFYSASEISDELSSSEWSIELV